eukprot:7377873-Prymnesium_polylepis.1
MCARNLGVGPPELGHRAGERHELREIDAGPLGAPDHPVSPVPPSKRLRSSQATAAPPNAMRADQVPLA